MDWYLHGDDRAAIRALRHEVRGYLSRHAEPDGDISGAELIVEELVGNAARHAGGPIWVSLSWPGLQPLLTVRDLGPGFDVTLLAQVADRPVSLVDAGVEHLVEDPPVLEASRPYSVDTTPTDSRHAGERQVRGPEAGDAPADDRTVDDLEEVFAFAEGGRGLFLVSHLAPTLAAAARRGGGSEVSAELPVKRAPTPSFDPPRQTLDALPKLEEAAPGGGFGRESFLRALVVQLARAVEYQQGPEAAEAAVAQVGIDVGGQMEEEFRQARRVVGRLDPQQLAECYVRLKHAIDGGFYVIEANEDAVVLGNRRCPFGDVVRYAPSLCRMTSAVFGGIAARNSDSGADVSLEERIAVGDPGCRVVVRLRPPAEARAAPPAHHYRRPV